MQPQLSQVGENRTTQTAPEIRIIEGKRSHISCTPENIVLMLQIQSQASVLRNVMTYLRQVQAEQLTEAHEVTPTLTIPDKGSPEDIANRAALNSLQGYFKTSIQYMESLVKILVEGSPELASQLEPFIAQLRNIGQSLPQLSDEQLQNVMQMMETLLKDVKQTPFQTRRFFWNQMLHMMQNLTSQSESDIKDLHQNLGELKRHADMLTSVEELLQDIQNTLKKNSPSKDEFLDLLSKLQDLANKYPAMNPAQAQGVMSFFEQLNDFKSIKGTKLSELIANGLLQTKLSKLLQTNPQASPEQIKADLEKFLKESNLQNSSLSLMHSVGDAIEEILDNEQLPSANDFSAQLADFVPTQKSVDGVEQVAESLSSTVSEDMDNHSAKREGYEIAVGKLSAAKKTLTGGAVWTVAESLRVGHPPAPATEASATTAATTTVKPPAAIRAAKARAPAPQPPAAIRAAATRTQAPSPTQTSSSHRSSSSDVGQDFVDAILNHVLPREENFMANLSITLFLLSQFSEFATSVMQNMIGWDSPGTSIDFKSNYCRPIDTDKADGYTPIFGGKTEDAEDQLRKENQAVDQYLSNARDSADQIAGEIDQINAQLATPGFIKQNPKQAALLEHNLELLQEAYDNLVGVGTPPTGGLIKQLEALKTELSKLWVHRIPRNMIDSTDKDHPGKVPDPNDPAIPGTERPNDKPTPYPGDSSTRYEIYVIKDGKPTLPGKNDTWQDDLQKVEHTAINGDSTAKPPGGLVHVHALIDNFHTNNSSQSQTTDMLISQETQKFMIITQLLIKLMETYGQMIQQCAHGITGS